MRTIKSIQKKTTSSSYFFHFPLFFLKKKKPTKEKTPKGEESELLPFRPRFGDPSEATLFDQVRPQDIDQGGGLSVFLVTFLLVGTEDKNL